jgi:hypothetical protein
MSKKNGNGLDLVPLTPPPGIAISGREQVYSLPHVPTAREIQIGEQWHEQVLVMDGMYSKATLGKGLILDLARRTDDEFLDTAAYFYDNVLEATGTGYEQAFFKFSSSLLQLTAQHLFGAVEIASGNIARVMHESLYPPPEPVKKPSNWLLRMLGG